MGPSTPLGSSQDKPPVLDLPKTPDTPNSQVEIRPAADPALSTPLAAAGGRWARYKDSSASLYSPPSVEVAKRFLGTIGGSVQHLLPRTLPTRAVRQSISDTPVSRRQCQTPSPDMICHGCHGPIGSGFHKGSAIGKAHCTLPHSYSCPGGIGEDDSWKSCPPNFPPGVLPGDTGFENTLGESAFQATPGIVGSTPALHRDSPVVHFQDLSQQSLARQSYGVLQQPPLLPVSSTNPHLLPASHIATSSNVVHQHELDEVRLYRQAQGEGARTRVIQDRIPSRMLGASSQQSGGSHLSDLEQEEAVLRARNQQQELNAAKSQEQEVLTIKDIRSVPGMRSEVEDHVNVFRTLAPVLGAAPSAPPPGISLPAPQPHPSQLTDMLSGLQLGTGHDQGPSQQSQELAAVKAQYAAVVHQQRLAARQLEQEQIQQGHLAARHQQQLQQELVARQQKAQDRATAEIAQYRRKIAEVESQLRSTQQAWQNQSHLLHPAPRVITTQTVAPHADAVTTGGGTLPLYEYLQGSDGRQYKVLKSTALPVSPVQQVPSTRLEYRCSPTSGRLYQVRVPVVPTVSPALSPQGHYTWHRDPRSGLMYQIPVPQHHRVENLPVPGPSVQQPQVYHQGDGTPAGHHVSGQVIQQQVQGSQQLHQLSRSYSGNVQDRVQGITNLSEREGGVKRPKLIDYVKKCPVKWAQQVKPDTMNIPVYAWGAVTEIIESLSGRAEALSEPELLGKLQHMQGVFEVCCINSTPVEYNSYGWTLARHYASKVQAKVDQDLLTWSTIQPGVQTAELVAAQMEYPKPLEKKLPSKKPEDEKQMCHTYNSCNVEGKCDYEVAHPGKSCQRKHECSWCRKNLGKGHRHQVWKCVKKVESGQ